MFKKTPETAKYPVKLSVPGLFLSLVPFLRGVTPHFLKFIEASVLRQHDVDHYIHIIDQDPLKGLSAFVFIGEFVAMFLHLVLD